MMGNISLICYWWPKHVRLRLRRKRISTREVFQLRITRCVGVHKTTFFLMTRVKRPFVEMSSSNQVRSTCFLVIKRKGNMHHGTSCTLVMDLPALLWEMWSDFGATDRKIVPLSTEMKSLSTGINTKRKLKRRKIYISLNSRSVMTFCSFCTLLFSWLQFLNRSEFLIT